MNNKFQLTLTFVLLSLIFSCKPKISSQSNNLTIEEKQTWDTLKIDTSMLQRIRAYNSNIIEPFHYALSKMYQDGKETELDPIYLNGFVFSEQSSKSYDLIFTLKDDFLNKGYTIFLLENNFNIGEKLDNIGVLNTVDKYEVLKLVGTNGANYDISNDSVITIIKQFDKKYALELIGASGDWCEFVINAKTTDWNEFANEVYKVCPDVVDQGTDTVEALADEMKSPLTFSPKC